MKKEYYKHKRTTEIVIIVSAIIFFGIAIAIFNMDQLKANKDTYIALMMLVYAVLFISWTVFRANVLRCPNCKKFICNFKHSDIGKAKEFICNNCEIIWDSGIIDDGQD